MTYIGRQQNTMNRFLGIGTKTLPIFDDFATQRQLWGPISPVRNMTQTIGKGCWKLRWSPTSSQNVLNFGPLTAKHRTVVFTHPLKSASVWQWRANIASFCLLFKSYVLTPSTLPCLRHFHDWTSAPRDDDTSFLHAFLSHASRMHYAMDFFD